MQKQIHGTSICYKQNGLLFLGESGTGKSDLALRLIDKGADLIADDQTILTLKNNEIILSCPEKIKSKLEIRGIGIIEMPSIEEHQLDIVFQLKSFREIERVPNENWIILLNQKIPYYEIDPFELSINAKINFLLKI
jgi:HPr kinase/phosphorylase